MPDDQARLDETRSWLSKASQDLRAAAHDLQALPPLLEDALFHSQQAVEKALKGFLIWHEEPFRKTHSLEELGEQCLRIDSSLTPFIDRAVPLTEYAWEFRYPGEAEEPTLEETNVALAVANEVYEAVGARLPAATRPEPPPG
jgi:HEPN domain-containing protein